MGYRINVKNAKYAPVSVDSATTYTIGTPVDLPGLMTIDLTMLTATGELYGDGAIVSKIAKATGATLKFGINKISTAVRAALLGSTVNTNGSVDTKMGDVPGQVAFYFETEQDDGKKEQLWLVSGKAEPFGMSAQQTESNVNYSTDEITINFVRREKDKLLYRLVDTNDTTVTSTYSSAFASDPDASTP